MSLIRRGLESRSGYPAFNSYVNPLNTLYTNVFDNERRKRMSQARGQERCEHKRHDTAG